MEGIVSIRTEESEEGDAESKGRNCRQAKQGEGVRCGLPCCSQGQKDQDPASVCAAADLSIPWPGVGCSLLFLTYSPLTSPPGLGPEADIGLDLGNSGEQVFSQGQELP